jgi:hypothetical protein
VHAVVLGFDTPRRVVGVDVEGVKVSADILKREELLPS